MLARKMGNEDEFRLLKNLYFEEKLKSEIVSQALTRMNRSRLADAKWHNMQLRRTTAPIRMASSAFMVNEYENG
uniref:Uncharacterized protein n=1 Tax=Curvibacter symbiont subsp. Hydra magnipapillata TaxID=667019 RepID=C9Y8X4_CURXX|nr:hypothetical protein Csp_A05750 [Curvibacter putative symbiont of Hydra magnipapillata]